jgi:DinB superfamily
MRTRTTVLMLSVLAVPAFTALRSSPPPKPDPAVAAILPLYEMDRNWILAAAEQMPEATYGYKPTPEVRNFGQMVGHVANAQYLFCSTAMGEENPNKQDFEKVAGKAELVTALKAGFAYCDKAYQMSGPKVMEEVTLFGMKGSRLWALNFNAVHNGEHYGNFIPYLRLNKMVPPSSQPQPKS